MSDTDPIASDPPEEAPFSPKASWPRKLLSVFWNGEERRIRALWRLITLIAVVTGTGLAIPRLHGLVWLADTRQ